MCAIQAMEIDTFNRKRKRMIYRGVMHEIWRPGVHAIVTKETQIRKRLP